MPDDCKHGNRGFFSRDHDDDPEADASSDRDAEHIFLAAVGSYTW